MLPYRVAEQRIVFAFLEPISAAVLRVSPAGRQVRARVQFIINNRATPQRRPDDPVSSLAQNVQQLENAVALQNNLLPYL
jgi:hypothetical protein